MQEPTMMSPQVVAPNTTMLGSYMPLPGMGVIPVNAYVIKGAQPVLVDTGLAALREPFLAALEAVVDPTDLKWIWLTHTDADHIGNLTAVLERAPQATVVTSFLGLGKLGLSQIHPQRFFLLNPGQKLDAGDRQLVAFRPPTYDAPETTGLYDTASSALLSSDCFGALLPEPFEHAQAIPEEALMGGQIGWATIDAPWLHGVDTQVLSTRLSEVKALGPASVLSSHLPPASGLPEAFIRNIRAARDAAPFVGPDQEALEKMMAG